MSNDDTCYENNKARRGKSGILKGQCSFLMAQYGEDVRKIRLHWLIELPGLIELHCFMLSVSPS